MTLYPVAVGNIAHKVDIGDGEERVFYPEDDFG